MANDISQHIHLGTASLYADDTLIYCDGNSIWEVNDKLHECINNVSEWYTGNRIVINAKKCSTMLTASKTNLLKYKDHLDITLQNTKLTNEKELKYLGIQIDSDISWDSQINKLCKNLAFKVSQLGRISREVPQEILNTINNSGIQPIIDYAITGWGTTTKQNLDKVQRIQNYATRIVLKNFDYIHV